MPSFNRPLWRAYLTALVVLVTLSSGAFAQADLGATLAKINIKNFGQIDENYYRGSQPEGQHYSDLAALGVKTVINLIGDDPDPNEKSLVESAGMKYVYIPMTTHVPPTVAQLSEFLGIVNDPESQPVYVHCVGGKHRTGVMSAVYRMTQNGWTAEQAYKEMKKYKFGPSFFHPEFKRFVYDYYAQLDRAPVAPEPSIAATETASQ